MEAKGTAMALPAECGYQEVQGALRQALTLARMVNLDPVRTAQDARQLRREIQVFGFGQRHSKSPMISS